MHLPIGHKVRSRIMWQAQTPHHRQIHPDQRCHPPGFISGAFQRGAGQGAVKVPRCNGDRFACLPTSVRGKGTVHDAVVTGEQPGVSASVRVTMLFGKATVMADVDVVFEDGAWKVDQVRCEAPAE